MNNRELDDLLKSARVPERDEEYWRDFPRRILADPRRKQPLTERRSPRWGLRLAWGLGLATACVVIGFLIGNRHGQQAAFADNGLLQNRKVIEEIMTMFPNRVRAIVQDEHGMNIVLADQPEVPESTPLWVKVCRGTRCLTLVTFSGQELEIEGQYVTVLSDAKGGVILEGDRFAWASSEPELAPADLKIQAHPLEFAALR